MTETERTFRAVNGKRRILVVEDEQINREILQFMLQDTYDVLPAETGSRAVEILETDYETLSLVLLDLNLPDMKGLDILRTLKGNAQTASLPVIVMTADQDTEVESLNLGATDFISKPYPKHEIVLARIRRTIELFEDRDTIRSTERDHLTGLYNREYFYRYASQFDAFHPDVSTDAVLLNINHFHMINERYGRDFGDEVLRQVAEKLQEAVRDTEGIISRREADTFLVYCPHREDYKDMLDSICSEMGTEYHVRARMGVYSGVDRKLDIERRFDRAKQAADMVKNSYLHAVGFFDDSMHEKELFAERLLEDFRTAIQEKQFTLHYQPKFDVRGDQPVLNSAEALVRWRHPELGMISPGDFIPLFEKNGLIRELDSYVWREAAGRIRTWKETLGRSIPLSVNVSRIDLYDPQLLETLIRITEEAQIERQELLLEITESAYTDNAERIIEVVRSLRENGFYIEMDDFGTGYSSLNMIATLPIDALKLDMQFIRTAFRGRKDTRLIEAVIRLAQSMGLPTIAEGVETAEQMFTLKSIGCDIVQGYYFSRPLPQEEFESYVRALQPAQVGETGESANQVRKGQKDRFTYEAMHDSLTGLYNHSAFDILFHDADQDHIAVMIATVDGYQQLLAEKGKTGADRVIRRVAEVLKSSFRNSDDICRLREDEFVIIMSRMTGAMQKQVFDKLDQIFEKLKEPSDGQDPVTLSVGIAFSDRTDPQGDVFEDADTALRRMKQMRQNGCAVY